LYRQEFLPPRKFPNSQKCRWVVSLDREDSATPAFRTSLTDISKFPDASRGYDTAKHFMNRDRIEINWKFDRTAARRKFGHKRKAFMRSKT